MSDRTYSGALISDFGMQNFSAYLENDPELPKVQTILAPFDQVIPTLMQKDLPLWHRDLDFAAVWTQPERVIKPFADTLSYKNPPLQSILEEIDHYASLLLDISDRAHSIFVPTWVLPSYHRGFGMLDMKTGIGIANVLMRMNLRLAEHLDQASNLHLLNAQKWIEAAGKQAFSPKLWYMAKIPFGNDVLQQAAKDLKSALRGIGGNARKLIIVDLDDTLWGGIVGDIGWQNLQLGGHDPVGEALVGFQRALKSLSNRGILLAIVSKNEEDIALEAINKHPEMILRLEDFSGWMINWRDKAENVIDLTANLNLGLDSVVFIDDSPVERARVRDALPQVLVPEWPDDKMLYESALLNLPCFDAPSFTNEDTHRVQMYASETQRDALKKSIASLNEWLKSLNIVVTVDKLNNRNLHRCAQLLNKTNQMNLTTRRMPEPELWKWAAEENHRFWTFRVSDRFGDSGLTGLASLEMGDSNAKIVDFVLSCRVMGRGIEETMLYTLIKDAKELQVDELYAQYIPTPKNKPCLNFLEASGFYKRDVVYYTWPVSKDYLLPEHITIYEAGGR